MVSLSTPTGTRKLSEISQRDADWTWWQHRSQSRLDLLPHLADLGSWLGGIADLGVQCGSPRTDIWIVWCSKTCHKHVCVQDSRFGLEDLSCLKTMPIKSCRVCHKADCEKITLLPVGRFVARKVWGMVWSMKRSKNW